MNQLFCVDCQTKARTDPDQVQRLISLLQISRWVDEDVCQCCLYPCKLEASNKRLTDALEMATTNLATKNKRLTKAMEEAVIHMEGSACECGTELMETDAYDVIVTALNHEGDDGS